MKFTQLDIPGVWMIEPVRHGDSRGYFSEVFKMEEFRSATGVDTVFIQKVQRDSVFLRDSIFIKEQRRNDTVFVDRVRYRETVREVIRRDTIYKTKTDSVTAVIDTVEQKSSLDATMEYIGRVFVLIVGCALLFLAIRFFVKR